MQRRHVQRAEPVVAQPAQVTVKERPQVGDAVFQHGDSVDAHAKGKALPFFGVNAIVSLKSFSWPCTTSPEFRVRLRPALFAQWPCQRTGFSPKWL